MASLSPEQLEQIVRNEWWWTARPEQVPPLGSWFLFLYLAGRGAGKTRSGAEWLVERTVKYPVDRSGAATEHLVIAETLSDARTICIEGPSGVLRVLERREIDYKFVRSPKPKILVGEHKTKIYFEGADNPDVGRGYTAASGWLDEIIKWPYPKQSWIEGIMPSMRADLVDDHPRIFVTTTPRPLDLLYEWVQRDDGSVHIVRGSTYDNADNLSEYTINELRERYEGTRIGQQELYGELLDSFEGSLFRMSDINKHRVNVAPAKFMHIALGVDPSLTGDDAEMGCVVVGRTADGHLYVLGDETIRGTGRQAADHCWRVFRTYSADTLVCENTQGKEWLNQVMRDSFKDLQKEGYFRDYINPPLRTIDSKRGKRLRAQPVAMRTEQGRVHHVGHFEALERQMISWIPEDTARTHRNSPDRLDALVHACWLLMEFDKKSSHYATPAKLGGKKPLRIPEELPNTGRLTVVRRSA